MDLLNETIPTSNFEKIPKTLSFSFWHWKIILCIFSWENLIVWSTIVIIIDLILKVLFIVFFFFLIFFSLLPLLWIPYQNPSIPPLPTTKSTWLLPLPSPTMHSRSIPKDKQPLVRKDSGQFFQLGESRVLPYSTH